MDSKGFTSLTGLTFLEIVIALSILAVALLGYSLIYKTSLDSSYRATQEMIATNLARGLVAEIMSKDFVEPGSDPENPPALGPDGETRFGSNGNAFDDVDDYLGYSQAPPYAISGHLMDGGTYDGIETPNYSDFTRTVSSVEYVNFLPDGTYDDNLPPGDTTDYKKVMVTVSGPYVRDIKIDGLMARPAP